MGTVTLQVVADSSTKHPPVQGRTGGGQHRRVAAPRAPWPPPPPPIAPTRAHPFLPEARRARQRALTLHAYLCRRFFPPTPARAHRIACIGAAASARTNACVATWRAMHASRRRCCSGYERLACMPQSAPGLPAASYLSFLLATQRYPWRLARGEAQDVGREARHRASGERRGTRVTAESEHERQPLAQRVAAGSSRCAH